MKSNRFSLIAETFEEINIDDNVLYLHSILGLDEKYLEDSNQALIQNGRILQIWNNEPCFIEDDIKKITLKIATSGAREILNMMRYQWPNVKGQVVYSYIAGHGDILLGLSETNVEALITMLLPGGFLTHENPIYNFGLYNIESTICIKEKEWTTVDSHMKSDKKEDMPSSKCAEFIERYQKYLPSSDHLEEGLFSYYQAFVLTLNILMQYENFKMSKNVYNLVASTLTMFDAQLTTLLKRADETDKRKRQKIYNRAKEAIDEYLECVNSIVYHTVHTDQIYLMIPGYSGTFFSVPIKLSQFYMWFMKVVMKLINDGPRNYSCILMPVMETKPATKEIKIDDECEDKLICVKLSQRQL